MAAEQALLLPDSMGLPWVLAGWAQLQPCAGLSCSREPQGYTSQVRPSSCLCSGSGLCSNVYVLRQFGRIADLNFYPEVDNTFIYILFYPGCSSLSMMQLSSPSCSNKVMEPRGERTCEKGLTPVHGGVMGFAFLLLLQDLCSRALWHCPC